jgi:cobaltochelatase CobN
MPASASYPMFHYDVARTGNVTGDAPITNQLLWSSDITGGCVAASPIISNGKVFISNWCAAWHGGVEALYCLNETTGEILWTNSLGGSGTASTAAISGDKLFVGSIYSDGAPWPSTAYSGDLYGINASTGATLWNTTIEHSSAAWCGVGSSPVVHDDKIYVTTYSNASLNNGTLHVLDFNGNYLWNVSAGANYHYTSPAIADGKVFFSGNLANNHSLFCVNIYSPYNTLWRFNTANNTQVKTTPAIWNDTVFFASEGYTDRLYAVNASTGIELWNNSFSSKMSSPALAYGNVFIGSNPTGNLSCFNASTGDNVWNFTANGKIDSSPLIANNTVYFGTNTASGTVYALNVTDGSLRWSYTLSPPSGSSYNIMSSPAVSSGTVFIGSDYAGILAFSPSGANITSFTMESASSAKGQSFTARVNITTSSDAVSGWYVVAVSGVNSNGNSLAGIGTVYLNSSDAVNRMPVLVHVPSLAESGVYNLYAVIYRLNNYPSVLLDREGSVSVTVS